MNDPLLKNLQQMQSLDDVVKYMEQLEATGYQQTGQWDLAAICSHLEIWMRYCLDGFPPARFPQNVMLFLLRNTIAPGMLRKAIETRSMAAGSPTLPETLPVNGQSPQEALGRYRDTVGRFEHHTGSLHASPLFGKLDHKTFRRLHLVHAIHHLQFLQPMQV
jgi:Protein of unknown function (DUF1569)